MTVTELTDYAVSHQLELPNDALNKRRLIRVIEQGAVNKKCTQLDDNTVVIGIKSDRETLRMRSRQRSEQMLADGLIEETKRLIQQYGLVEPLRRNAYGVVHQYLNGDITGRDELIDRMVIADGHLVKKQLTWWRSPRRVGDIMWRSLDDLNKQMHASETLDDLGLLSQLIAEYKNFQNTHNTGEND